MYYNGKKGYHISTFLKEVHNSMTLKYGRTMKEDIEKAKKLQDFFRDIKNAAQNNEMVNNEMIQMIIESIQLPNKELLKNLFKGTGRTSGKRFENELTAIIRAVCENLTDEEIDLEQINIGSQKANLDIQNFKEKMTQKVLKAVGTKTKNIIEENNKKIKQELYLSSVEGKIDVKGYEINIKANANPKLVEIYNLLKDATFSAKNYNSKTWNKEIGQSELNKYKNLTLGKSNLYRSIIGPLNDLGYDQRTAESALWASLNKIKDGDTNIANHFYHLRYIYELTGSGLVYKNGDFGGVRFLIYNDPSGEIYVKASSEILAEVLEEHIGLDKVLSGISIPKSKFLN